MEKVERPGEAEIAAYVDGEMPAAERAELEALAANDRDLAVRLLEDMRLNLALRRGQPRSGSYTERSFRLALALQRRLRVRAHLPTPRKMAAALAFVALGWSMNTVAARLWGTSSVADERFVDGAREALRVAAIDAGTPATGEPIGRKIVRLETATDVVLPTLPANWKVHDVQVQPFDGKLSVVVTAESPILGRVTLVAAPMETESAVPPTPARDETVPTVYWQSGGTAYALMGPAAPTQLKSVADGLEVASRRKIWPKTRG